MKIGTISIFFQIKVHAKCDANSETFSKIEIKAMKLVQTISTKLISTNDNNLISKEDMANMNIIQTHTLICLGFKLNCDKRHGRAPEEPRHKRSLLPQQCFLNLIQAIEIVSRKWKIINKYLLY